MLIAIKQKHIILLLSILTIVLLSNSAFAEAAATTATNQADVTNVLNVIINFITGTMGKSLAILGLMIIGIGALFGFFDMRKAGFWALGIVLIFSAAWIVDQIVVSGS